MRTRDRPSCWDMQHRQRGGVGVGVQGSGGCAEGKGGGQRGQLHCRMHCVLQCAGTGAGGNRRAGACEMLRHASCHSRDACGPSSAT